jgi:putative DNA methylase
MSTNPPYKKKLIEVALPLDEINKQAAREKSIRHGHPSTLHVWWARRPLAACRAVLFAQLVDDPSSHPDEFPSEEDRVLERKRLFNIIERLVNWDNISDESLYEEARREIWKSCDGNPPPILDPFAGGGSIPLEAQRLGLEVHASDLNPVPVLINKALIEIPPTWAGMAPVFPDIAESRLGGWPGATGLAEDIRRYGKWMRDEAEKRIGHLYPKAKLGDGTEANVIAWIWARTITCPNPTCGGTTPLIRSFWLSKKKGNERYIEPIVENKSVRFDICGPKGKPQVEGTVGRTGATCLICNTPVPLSYIRSEGKAGRISVKLIAIVAEGRRVRYYLPATDEHERSANVKRPSDAPEANLPRNPRDFKTPNYGFDTFDKLFTSRQLVTLTTFSNLVAEMREKALSDARAAGLPSSHRLADGGTGAEAYADAVATYLGIVSSKAAVFHCTQARWRPDADKTAPGFGRQAIPMVWDFAEVGPFAGAGGDWTGIVEGAAKVIESSPAQSQGVSIQSNATRRDYAGMVVCTDPPYYDNVSYGELSDFFYVWLRRSLQSIFPDILSTMLTPKDGELIAHVYRHGGKEESTRFFEEGFQETFTRMREGATPTYPMTVFYAFKQSESYGEGESSSGWETLLEGIIRSGWSITATWPMRTEMATRMIAANTNALASSVVLACRPRPQGAPVIDRRGLINALKAELPQALRDLQQGGVAPVDLAQAAIGPGMAVFSRYAQVTEADGLPMRVRAALIMINQILAEVLSDQEGDFDSDTRFCLKWFETHGFDLKKSGFGEAETLSKAMDTSVLGLDRAGVLKARGGDVQLFSPSEMPEDYDPVTDDRLSVWEVVMHLAKQINEQGIDAAARLMASARSRVNVDTAKELTYLLYSICEKRKWADTGLLFNELGTAWTEIEKASRTAAPLGDVQGTFDYAEED